MQELKQSKRSNNSSLDNILISHRDLIVPFLQFQLGEDLGTGYPGGEI